MCFVNVGSVISILKKRKGNFVRVLYIFSFELQKIQYIKCQKIYRILMSSVKIGGNEILAVLRGIH